MTKKEIEALCSATNKILSGKREVIETPIGVYECTRLDDDEYKIVEPFLKTTRKCVYYVGSVELETYGGIQPTIIDGEGYKLVYIQSDGLWRLYEVVRHAVEAEANGRHITFESFLKEWQRRTGKNEEH